MNSLLSGSRVKRWSVLLLLFALVFCIVLLWRVNGSRLVATGSKPMAKALTPAELYVELLPAATLLEAAQGFAEALGIPPEKVLVRLRFSGCAVCATEEDAPQSDVTVAEATQLARDLQSVPAGGADGAPDGEHREIDAFWLVYNDLICFHQRQGETWVPKSCAIFLPPGKG